MTWVPLDFTALQLKSLEHSREESGGSKTVARPSPLDIPEAMQIEADAANQTFILRLKYITNENNRELFFLTTGLSLQRGKASGRIYEIHINVPGPFNKDSISRAVHAAAAEISGKAAANRGGSERAATFQNKITGQLVDRTPSLVPCMGVDH